jgi:hypothetical protein
MKPSGQRFLFDAPGAYRIRIQGHLDPHWSDTFCGMKICARQGRGKPAMTTLSGRLIDQVSLMGVLAALYDMGYTLLEVKRLPDPTGAEAANRCMLD